MNREVGSQRMRQKYPFTPVRGIYFQEVYMGGIAVAPCIMYYFKEGNEDSP